MMEPRGLVGGLGQAPWNLPMLMLAGLLGLLAILAAAGFTLFVGVWPNCLLDAADTLRHPVTGHPLFTCLNSVIHGTDVALTCIDFGGCDTLRFDGRDIWIKGADEPFDAARPITADDRPVPGYFWSRDSSYVLYVQDRDGDENGPVNGEFLIEQSTASITDTEIDYTVTGTATAGTDYTALSGSVTVPAGATTAPLVVANDAGADTTDTDFVVIRPPSIALFSPDTGTVGTEVTVTGSGFDGLAGVAFGATMPKEDIHLGDQNARRPPHIAEGVSR